MNTVFVVTSFVPCTMALFDTIECAREYAADLWHKYHQDTVNYHSRIHKIYDEDELMALMIEISEENDKALVRIQEMEVQTKYSRE